MTIEQNQKATREKTLATTYLELHRFGQNGDYDRALKAANRSKIFLSKHMLYDYMEFISF